MTGTTGTTGDGVDSQRSAVEGEPAEQMAPEPENWGDRDDVFAKLDPAPPSRWANLFGIDVRALASLRIGVAIILLYETLLVLPDVPAFYAESGVYPRSLTWAWNTPARTFYPHLWEGSVEFQYLLFSIHLGLIGLLLAGLFTRWVTFGNWLFILSYQGRNPMLTQGSDEIMRLLLFWGMLLPWSAVWSLDALRRDDIRLLPRRVVSWPSVGLLVQVAAIYVFSAILKSGPAWRIDGTAIYYTLSVEYLTSNLGRQLLEYPRLMRAMTFGAWWLEAVGPLLAFSPWANGPLRVLVVLGFLGFHLGLAATMLLGTFPYVSCLCWIPFIPTGVWDWVTGVGARVGRPLSKPIARWANALRDSWLGEIAEPKDPLCTSTSFAVNAAGFFAMTFVLAWNLATVGFPVLADQMTGPMGKVAHGLRLDQKWGMFAPEPLVEDGWYVVLGKLEDGSEVDLWRDGTKISWDKPTKGDYYPNFRWRCYMVNMWRHQNENVRPFFADYLARRWNEAHPDRKVRYVSIYVIEEKTLPDYQASKPKRLPLHTHVMTLEKPDRSGID